MNDLLVLIDGSSYFYRAFHALPPLSNSQGQPTGAIYGVINMIKRLIKDYHPQYLAVVFDAKGKTFRDDLYAGYKANREAMPDDLHSQFEPMVEIIDALGLPIIIVEGVEADDVIATLAVQASEKNIKTLISTGDKDLAQLVNDKVTLINTMSNSILDPAGVLKKFEIGPELIVDYLSLIGDKTDNIPGIPKVGPKTAVKWLNAYGSLAGVMEHAHEITGKVGENLRACLNQLPLAKQLATVKRDVPIKVNITDLQEQKPNNSRLIELYKQYEFKNWLNDALRHEETVESTSQIATPKCQIILNNDDLSSWLALLNKASHYGLSLQLATTNPISAPLIGLAVAVENKGAAYIPLAHDDGEAPAQLSVQYVLSQLKPILENPKCTLVIQNYKSAYIVFKRYGINVQNRCYDPMLESYILNSSLSRHDLSTLCLRYLGHKTTSLEEIVGKGTKQINFNQIAIDKAANFAAEETFITMQLHNCLMAKITETPQLLSLLDTLEMPLARVLAKMESYGVLIDTDHLAMLKKELSQRLAELESEIINLAGESFNLNSPKQLQHILYEKLKLPILEKTATGQPSTAENVLTELAFDFPLPKVILEYRSLSKLLSTYIEALPKCINPETNRVHTSYNQAVTTTGRLSSTEPNLQNIPTRSESGRQIRKAFIAATNFKILAADYSQIELRIMAHLSQDQALLKAFNLGWDIHSATAAEVLAIPLEQVTAEQRRRAKMVNFGLIYGMSAFGLAKRLGINREYAQQYIDLYFARYPGVKQYMDKTREQAHQTGYVETILGRRLYLPEINVRNLQRQRAAERAAINAPMQGTAADIIKQAMIDIDNWIEQSKLEITLIMQVHDELVFEVAKQDLAEASKQIKYLMEKAITLSTPLEVSIGSGDNWEEAH